MTTLLSRRALIHTLACGCAAAPGSFLATPALAAASGPKTTLSPDEALAKLKEGNAAFVKGGACMPAGGDKIAPLAAGQAPFAVIVGCSDSRVPPEHVFSRQLGELFTIRVAGNTVDRPALGSIGYGTAVLGAPLVVVLGHAKCGAVDAAVSIVTKKAKYPGAIGDMIKPVLPAVADAQKAGGGGDLVAAAVRANVVRVVAQLKKSDPSITGPLMKNNLKIVGGVYDLASGAVDYVA
jgi:carbonic anhydrase